ncbi:MAG: glutamate--tRNA ligase family protein, partial [Acidobacteriota bacterium]|nr:glutamate--tRNA ligase family protein [Acidobacteriota bacterium]
MNITHVIRGQDHINNTHKQVLLYQALGKPVPKFAHLPLILASNKSKLSKRKHGEIVSVTTYRDRGIIPDVFVNFLALLGWSPAGIEGMEGQELFMEGRELFIEGQNPLILGPDALISFFSLESIHKSNAVFNLNEGDARNWTMNAEYIKIWGKWHPFFPDLPDNPKYQEWRALQVNSYRKKFFPLVKAELANTGLWRDEYEGDKEEWFCKIISLLSERARTLKDFSVHGRPYFVDGLDFEFDEAAVKKNLQKDPVLKTLLPELADTFAALIEFTPDTIAPALRGFAEAKDVKINLLTNAARTALTGQAVGPSLFDLIAAVGQKRAVERLKHAANLI